MSSQHTSKTKKLKTNKSFNKSVKKSNKDFKSGVRCAGFVVICKIEKKVLLVATHKGAWGFPKGKLDKNETLEKCAFRELKEETGLSESQINPVNMESVFFDEITDKGNPSVRLYLATTDSIIKPKVEDVDELDKAVWVDFDEASKLLIIKNRKQILDDAIKSLESELIK